MEGNLPCARHEAEIKTLFKKVEEISDIRQVFHNLDKNMAVQTEMLKNIVEHNKKQDERMDKQDKRMDEQHKVMTQMSENLTRLNTEVIEVKDEIREVKEVQSTNENKHLIDLRDINKEEKTTFLKKYGMPLGIGIAIGGSLLPIIIEVIKILK